MKYMILIMISACIVMAAPIRTVIGKGSTSTTSGLSVGRCDIDSLNCDTARVTTLTVSTLYPDSNSHWSIDYLRADTIFAQTYFNIASNRYLSWGYDSTNTIRIDNNGTKQLRIGSTASVYATIDSATTYINSIYTIMDKTRLNTLSVKDTATNIGKITIIDTFLIFIVGNDSFAVTPY